jgi:hypothetical protein
VGSVIGLKYPVKTQALQASILVGYWATILPTKDQFEKDLATPFAALAKLDRRALRGAT